MVPSRAGRWPLDISFATSARFSRSALTGGVAQPVPADNFGMTTRLNVHELRDSRTVLFTPPPPKWRPQADMSVPQCGTLRLVLEF